MFTCHCYFVTIRKLIIRDRLLERWRNSQTYLLKTYAQICLRVSESSELTNLKIFFYTSLDCTWIHYRLSKVIRFSDWKISLSANYWIICNSIYLSNWQSFLFFLYPNLALKKFLEGFCPHSLSSPVLLLPQLPNFELKFIQNIFLYYLKTQPLSQICYHSIPSIIAFIILCCFFAL